MDIDRLTNIAKGHFAKLAQDPVLNVIVLPDGLGVCVVHAVRGGGSIYVAPDESALYVSSGLDFDKGLALFREGRRTPNEQFERD